VSEHNSTEEVHVPARGIHHVRAAVHHPPELDRDIEDYYALFVFDPDGIRVEVACAPSVDRFNEAS
jgi:hypothetical protein